MNTIIVATIVHPPPHIRKVWVGLRVCAFLVHKEKCSSMCEEAFMKLDAEPGSIKISNLGRWLKNFWCALAACPGAQKRDVLNRFLAKRRYFFNPGPFFFFFFASFFHGSFCCFFVFPFHQKQLVSGLPKKQKIRNSRFFRV